MSSVQYISKIPEVLRNLTKTDSKIAKLITEDLDRESYKLAPAVTNEMRNSRVVEHTPTGGQITYTKIYSARLYFGETFVFSKAENPLAGALWGRRAILNNTEKWINFSAEMSKRGMK